MNHQKRENGAAFLAECMILNPSLRSLPILQADIVRKYEEGHADVLYLLKEISSLGTNAAMNTAAEAQVKLVAAEEILNEMVEVLVSAAVNLSQIDDPQVQGLVAGIEEYLSKMGD